MDEDDIQRGKELMQLQMLAARLVTDLEDGISPDRALLAEFLRLLSRHGCVDGLPGDLAGRTSGNSFARILSHAGDLIDPNIPPKRGGSRDLRKRKLHAANEFIRLHSEYCRTKQKAARTNALKKVAKRYNIRPEQLQTWLVELGIAWKHAVKHSQSPRVKAADKN